MSNLKAVTRSILWARLERLNTVEITELFDLNVSALMSLEGDKADKVAEALEIISDVLYERDKYSH